jgi:hypothetical protein
MMFSIPWRCARGSALLTVAALTCCTHTVKVEPIKVEPIDITLHIYLEADQKLDAFFGDVDAPADTPAGNGQTEGVK